MIQAFQLILALCFLVMIHEFGHFAFAKLFHVRVEKFYMFFNPKISLFRMKKFDGKWHFAFLSRNTSEDPEHEWNKHPETTEWGIGWVPLGGYCAIAGMIDETKQSTDLPSDPQPWEFRSKNVWQRMCIIIGGILVNFVAALVIFILLLFANGQSSLPLRNVDRGFYYSEILRSEGFAQGDRILSIDGVEPEDMPDLVQRLIIEGKRNVMVLRGQDTLALTMSEDLGNRYLATQQTFDRQERDKARADEGYQKQHYVLIAEYIPFVIDSVVPGGAASHARLQRGDSLVSVNGLATPSYYELVNQLQLHPCDSVLIDYYRGGNRYRTHVFLGDQCKLAVMPKTKFDYFAIEHTSYTFLEAIPAGIRYGLDYLKMYVKQFRLVFSKEGAQSVGGFGAIGNMFPSFWSWDAFWHMTAVLSLILAFMNFLPIPALDGGYILFLLWEMITGRQPSDKFLERANNIGFYILLALMILANGNDLLKLFF